MTTALQFQFLEDLSIFKLLINLSAWLRLLYILKKIVEIYFFKSIVRTFILSLALEHDSRLMDEKYFDIVMSICLLKPLCEQFIKYVLIIFIY